MFKKLSVVVFLASFVLSPQALAQSPAVNWKVRVCHSTKPECGYLAFSGHLGEGKGISLTLSKDEKTLMIRIFGPYHSGERKPTTQIAQELTFRLNENGKANKIEEKWFTISVAKPTTASGNGLLADSSQTSGSVTAPQSTPDLLADQAFRSALSELRDERFKKFLNNIAALTSSN